MAKQTVVIGGGFSGMVAAAYLAKAGRKVLLLEKNEMLGGRARRLQADGFSFDMGPSWYWMPEVFERFFNDMGHKTEDFYRLHRLDPSYSVYFGPNQKVDLPAGRKGMVALFERMEPGSGQKLLKFLDESGYKYNMGMSEFVYKPGLSVLEFLDKRVLSSVLKLDMFKSISRYIRQHFTNPQLIQLLEFPVLFLGAMPENTPALYSLMNYADIELGTWYPNGGMYSVVEAMQQILKELKVEVLTNMPVQAVEHEGKRLKAVVANGVRFNADDFVVSADYHHWEQNILPTELRRYSAKYWQNRQLAPSSLLFYWGFDTVLKGVDHHSLFFDTSFEQHARDIYQKPAWPENPLFYLSDTSKTDPKVAPAGHEAVVVLIPLAPGLEHNDAIRTHYRQLVLDRLEHLTGQELRSHLVFERSYAHREFVQDYNAFKGNAYGLANTLRQTALLKPSMRSKLNNMWYTGQLTVPGPGVPPSIISGNVVAQQILKS